jgi:hypothetical protein
VRNRLIEIIRQTRLLRFQIVVVLSRLSKSVQGGASEAGFPYLARPSEEQSSIGFQPVSNVDDGWFAFFARTVTADWLKSKARLVGDSLQAGSLCYITPWRVNLGARRSSVRRISIPRVPVRKAKYHRLPACIERRRRLVRVVCEDGDCGWAEDKSKVSW